MRYILITCLLLHTAFLRSHCTPLSSPHLTFEEHEEMLRRGDVEHQVHPQEHETCNKEICASIVSYCLIQEMCSCDTSQLHSCSCCKGCAVCLSERFDQCSDCVGIPNKQTYKEIAENVQLVEMSVFNEIEHPSPELFSKWTDRQSSSLNYQIFKYPNVERLTSNMHHHGRHHGNQNGPVRRRFTTRDYELALKNLNRHQDDPDAVCTAAFVDKCLTRDACHQSCEAMGASFYGSFPSGCCGCFGHSCTSTTFHHTFQAKCRNCI